MKKIFGELNMTWPKVIIFAIITAVATALLNQVPALKDTSFTNMAISFEFWILCALLIMMNSKSALDSALKTFVFFLISQPLIYLVEVPFLGWSIMGYYKNWILWTIATLPMAFIGYYMKKDKWWGLLILTPMLIFLGFHYSMFLGRTIFNFPHHLISAIFCVGTSFMYVTVIFENKKIKIAGVVIVLAITAVFTFLTLRDIPVYNIQPVISNSEENVVFDDTYTVYLKDEKMGNAKIIYIDSLEEYAVDVTFKKAGKTELVLVSPDGEEMVFLINVPSQTYYEVERIK